MASPHTDPYFNLALEEYLLRHGEQDFFLLWQSCPAVIVGKHQNALAEVNYRFIMEKNILLARRLSGGGTVFHDRGNLNFSYIMHGESGKLVDFRRFIEPVTDFLNTLGIQAKQGPGNEILVGGMKVSGNAEHVHKNRVLHHGTLLYQADLELLQESIRIIPGRYADKAVQSKRSKVVNLSDYLPFSWDIETFGKKLMEYMMGHFNGTEFQPDEKTMKAIRELARSKYRTWEWIYGWSPDYEFRNVIHAMAYSLHIDLKIHRGIITGCSLVSGEIPGDHLIRLENRLNGCHHEAGQIRDVLLNWKYTVWQNENELQDLVFGFF
jgi:lipoate-protein ligase A